MKSHDNKNGVILYIILANLLAWLFRIPLALEENGLIHWGIPRVFQFIGDWGPAMAALILVLMKSGRLGLKNLVQRVLPQKELWKHYILALLAVPLLFLVTAGLNHYVLKNTWPDFNLLGRWEELPGLGPLSTWIVLFIGISMGEEIGWRGFLQEKLREKNSPMKTLLIIGSIWMIWHLPLFFFDEYFLFLTRNPGILFFWCLFVFAMSAIHGWLYEISQGNLLLPMIFHASLDWSIGSLASTEDPMISTLLGTILVLLSIPVVFLWRKAGARNSAGSS